jgi:8-oxo-dGTP diphosphatase
MTTKTHVRVVAAEIECDGRYLITQRKAKAILPLLWEFPGGRVERGETDQDALSRELLEKIGVDAEVCEMSLHVAHEYDNYTLDLLVYRATIREGEPTCVGVETIRWVAPEDFGDYEFPGADQQTVDALLDLE